jgi:hypothetical protein
MLVMAVDFREGRAVGELWLVAVEAVEVVEVEVDGPLFSAEATQRHGERVVVEAV